MPPNSLSYRETKDRIVISRLHWLKFIVDKGFLLSTNITIHLRLFGLVAIPTGSTRVNSLRERTLLRRCCEKPRISVDADDQILQVRVYNLEKGNMKEEEEEEEEEKMQRFARATLRDMANRAVCVFVSQPLQVICDNFVYFVYH